MSDEDNQNIDTTILTPDDNAAPSDTTHDDDTASDESENDSDESQDQAPKPAKKENRNASKRYEKRIDQLTYRAKTAEAKLAEFEAWKNEQEKKSSASATAEKPRPKKEDFDFDDEYHEALTDWKVDQKLFEREKKANDAKAADEKKQTQQKQQESSNKVIEELGAKEDAFAAENPDYDDLVADLYDSLPQTPAVARALNKIITGKDAPQVLYALAKDPALADEMFPERLSKIDSVLEKIRKSQASPQQKQLPNPPSRVPQTSGFKSDNALSGKDLLKKYKVK